MCHAEALPTSVSRTAPRRRHGMGKRGLRLRSLFLLVAAGWACRDSSNSPSSPRFQSGNVLHQVRWAGAGAPRFAFGALPNRRNGISRSATAVSGDPATFWAYTDRDASLVVNVEAADGTWQPYA